MRENVPIRRRIKSLFYFFDHLHVIRVALKKSWAHITHSKGKGRKRQREKLSLLKWKISSTMYRALYSALLLFVLNAFNYVLCQFFIHSISSILFICRALSFFFCCCNNVHTMKEEKNHKTYCRFKSAILGEYFLNLNVSMLAWENEQMMSCNGSLISFKS